MGYISFGLLAHPPVVNEIAAYHITSILSKQETLFEAHLCTGVLPNEHDVPGHVVDRDVGYVESLGRQGVQAVDEGGAKEEQ